ncbi:MAG TPA: 30S ribosomal protein S19 [Thermoplasmata archaeon]|jgi:small subunit ribosomal protein S19|nr:30S ribosomal protein S19 [Thermoplasmata archaeon]
MPGKEGGSAKAARRRLRKKQAGTEVRRKKEFTYRGFTLDELRAMPMEDVLQLLPARARRTFQRGIDDDRTALLEKLKGETGDEAVRTHSRDLPILPSFVGKKVAVHNGKEFVAVDIKPEMIGHYLGEFAMTRHEVKHSGPGVGATRSSKFMPLK